MASTEKGSTPPQMSHAKAYGRRRPYLPSTVYRLPSAVYWLLVTVYLLLLSGCLSGTRGVDPPLRTASAAPAARFTDATAAAGIRFKHTNGRSGRLYFPETTGSGCAFLDYDNDGRLDIFLINAG